MKSLTDLTDAIADYIRRPDVPAARCIYLAEADLRALRHRDMLRERTVTIPAGDTAFTLPDDFLELRALTLDGVLIRPVGLQQLRRRNASIGYAVSGGKLSLSAAQPVSAKVCYTYYAQLPALTEAAPSNWLLSKFPAVYLWASLAHAHAWDRDVEGENAARSRLGDALAIVAADHKRSEWGGNTPSGLPL